ncbi:MAG: hypothetical protein A3J29_19325 [Acidobacteria bacterium RIFCSPLOWO2_12_FULL_67_14b]|nr:MAG: hypothetical protein A3J29_19325 [Acidobacteria bacterium RIFCSPLOWO2_12_FULL_67_14b]
MTATPLLEVQEVSVHFGSIRAVDNVTLHVDRGEIIGLIGPNGAGKSTLINTITGINRPQAGALRFDGRDITREPVHTRARRGVARTFQNIELFPAMTLLDNVLVHVDVENKSRSLRYWWPGELSRSREDRRTAELALESVSLLHLAHRLVDELSYPERKLLEFARAMVGGASLLLLDEPTAGLAMEDRFRTVDRMHGHIAERGLTVIVVEHDMAVIRKLASRVYVMDAGCVIASGTFSEVIADPLVMEAYLG